MTRYAVDPERFVMVGNSLRSDILPVIEAGGHAVYVPYEVTWVHERVPAEQLESLHFHEIANIRELPACFSARFFRLKAEATTPRVGEIVNFRADVRR